MESISAKQWIIVLILVGLICFGAGGLFGVKYTNVQNNAVQKNLQKQSFNVQDDIPKPKSDEVQYFTVYVTGEVKKPDVYKLPAGSIVKDAILKAGGANEDANLVAVNLAKKISDSEEIIIPKKGISVVSQSSATGGEGGNDKININTAGVSALEKLPGIGEVKANAIIQYRKSYGLFKTVHDITRVSGIGEKTFEKLKNLITVG